MGGGADCSCKKSEKSDLTETNSSKKELSNAFKNLVVQLGSYNLSKTNVIEFERKKGGYLDEKQLGDVKLVCNYFTHYKVELGIGTLDGDGNFKNLAPDVLKLVQTQIETKLNSAIRKYHINFLRDAKSQLNNNIAINFDDPKKYILKLGDSWDIGSICDGAADYLKKTPTFGLKKYINKMRVTEEIGDPTKWPSYSSTASLTECDIICPPTFDESNCYIDGQDTLLCVIYCFNSSNDEVAIPCAPDPIP